MVQIIRGHLVGVERCPQCGIAHPNLEYRHHFAGTRHLGASLIDLWITYRCNSCGDAVSVKTVADPSVGWSKEHFDGFVNSGRGLILVIQPAQTEVDSDLPQRSKTYLEQAIQSLHAPDGAAMLAGSAVDAMLKERGLTKGSVYDRIKEAVNQRILTNEMADWAHEVRLGANSPRHSDLSDPHVSADQAQQSIAFAKALGDFLFVFPARVARGKADATKAITPA